MKIEVLLTIKKLCGDGSEKVQKVKMTGIVDEPVFKTIDELRETQVEFGGMTVYP
jgi:hypothetical protein